jgi:large repetitive protein
MVSPRCRPLRAVTLAIAAVGALVALAPTSVARAATVTIAPKADAYVSSAAPRTNFGSATELRAGSSPELRSYLRFDLAGVMATISQATLRLYAASGTSVGYDVRSGGSKNFNEKTITYQNAPSVGAVVASVGPFAAGWTAVDVTSMVTAGAATTIAVTSTSLTALSFTSREVAQFAPTLEVVTDNTPPTVTLTQPADGSSTNDATPAFRGVAGTSSGDSATVTVKVYAAGSGTPLQTLSATRDGSGSYSVDAAVPVADGAYSAQAEQTDSAGNTGFSSRNAFTVDTAAPVVTLTTPAGGSSTSDATPDFAGTAGRASGDSSTVSVKIFSGSAPVGTPLQTLTTTATGDGSYSVPPPTPLPDGTYSARAEQSDLGGNLGQASTTFTVDTVPPPAPSIDTRPSDPSSSASASFTFSDTELGVAFLCGLDGGASSLCTSPKGYGGLADGPHTFDVKARDAAGNLSGTTTYAWRILAPPIVVLTAPADGSSTNDSTPTFRGVAGTNVDDGTLVTVTVYAGTTVSGNPIQTLGAFRDAAGNFQVDASSSLADGVYTARAEQSDSTSTGFSSPNTFRVDTVPPPAPSIGAGPSDPSNSASASLSFSDTEQGVAFLCRLDEGASSLCTSPQVYSGLADGLHTFEVRARDAAGNVGAAATRSWTVDTAAPVVNLAVPAAGAALNDQTPTFSGVAGTASGDGTTVVVRIYAGSSAGGTPLQTLTTTRASNGAYVVDAAQALSEGSYTARAEQADSAGNTGQSSANTFRIDLTAPALTLTSPANGSSVTDSTPAVTGSAGTAPGDAGSVVIRIYGGSTPTGPALQTLTAPVQSGAFAVDAAPLQAGTYTTQAEQTDSAGNIGVSAASTFTVTSAAGYGDTVEADVPVGYWRLGEASGSTAADETANASLGSYLGGVTLGVSGALASDPNTATRYDGLDDRISMGDPANGVLDFGTSDFSAEFWLRTTVTGEEAALSKVPASGGHWLITVSDDPGGEGTIRAKVTDGSVTRYAYGPRRVDDGSWHHVVVAVDRDTGITIYVDGSTSKFTAGAVTGGVSNAAPFMVAGGLNYPYFRGDLDEVVVYRSLLSAARVKAHYDAGVGAGTSIPIVTLTAPADGSSTSDTTPTFSGTASTDPSHSTTVTVKVYSGTSASGSPLQALTTTRGSNGSYAVDASPLGSGTYTARAEQSDGAGQVGYSNANTFTVTTPSSAVTLATPGNGATVPDTTPTFSGQARSGTGDAFAVTVKIYAGASADTTPTLTATATRDAVGAWAVDSSPALAPGTYTARAEQKDGAGNTEISAPSTFTITAPPPFPPTDPQTVSAGDIAGCDSTGDEATAQLLDLFPNAYVLTLGDHTYEQGTLSEFTNCYDPTWGRAKARTRPSVGDHEYNTRNAAGYFTYFNSQLTPFGASAADSTRGYYSYDLGTWHVVVLNSNCSAVGGCGATSPEVQWLRADLTSHAALCTLAYWHHPRFSSGGGHGSIDTVQPFWDALYENGVELVMNGNDHDYERFAPQTPAGRLDLPRGITQFIVGTGGRGLYSFANGTLKANSEVRRDDTFGVLKLTLHASSYEWEFVPVAGKIFTDVGSRPCH